MAWIIPDSTIYFLKGIRLNENYTDTAYFDTEQDQNDYFMSKVATSLTQENYSYLRHTVGQIKVKLTMRQLQGCTYMMFKNTGLVDQTKKYEDKWYYCFVTNYEYINDETTLVFFEIDLLQTYMFDYTTKPCMVERQHATDDTLGKNLVPEGLDTGEYVYDEQNDSHLLWTNWKICIFHTLNNDGNAVSTIDGQMMGGLYSGLNIKVCNTVAQANTFLTNVSACALEGAVVAVVMLPSDLINIDTYTYSGLTLPTTYTDINAPSYTPHNNKCYLAPFRGIYVTNGQGTVASYNIEDFSNPSSISFTLKFSLGCVSDCMLQPNNYRGESRQYGVELSGFPQCAYTTDGFKSWMARNAGFLALAQTDLEQQNQYQNQALKYQQQGLNIGINETNTAYKMDRNNTIAMRDLANRGIELQRQKGIVGGTIGAMGAGLAAETAVGAIAGTGPIGAIAGIGAMAYSGYQTIMGLDQQGLEQQKINMQADQAIKFADASNAFANQRYRVNTADIANQKAAINAANAIAIKQLAMQKHVASLTPPSFHGQSVGSATKLFGDFGYHIGIFKSRAQFVRKADDFFDLYGYAQNELFNPYRKARKHWTYIKTRGANFRDISSPLTNRGVPADDMAAINNLYDGGIRFWTDPDKIGNYTSKVDPDDPDSPTYQEDNTILTNPMH